MLATVSFVHVKYLFIDWLYTNILYAMAFVSVCLSVCLSVTLVRCVIIEPIEMFWNGGYMYPRRPLSCDRIRYPQK